MRVRRSAVSVLSAPRALVLHGPLHVDLELAGGPQRPVGLPQKLAGKQHRVGLFGAQDVLGLDRLGDEAHGAVGLPTCWRIPAPNGVQKPGPTGTRALLVRPLGRGS